MVLNNREKVLILLLMIILSCGGYYRYLIIPQKNTLEQIKLERTLRQQEYDNLQNTFLSESKTDEILEKTNLQTVAITKKYFGKIQQEDIILMLNEILLTESIKIPSVSFSPMRIENLMTEDEKTDEISEESTIVEVISTQFNFESSYEGLLSFLKHIHENDRKIIIKEINMNNRIENGLLSGGMVLDFYAIPQINKYHPAKPSILAFSSQYEVKNENPFMPFEGFPIADNNPSLESMYSDISRNGLPKKTLYGFEDQNTFFVGNPRDVYGKLGLDRNSMEGNYSLSFEYDFIRGREYNAANLVFDGKPIYIARQPESFGLWIYNFEINTHTLGAVLIDSKGREFKVPLTNNMSWLGWDQVETSLPIEITYPAVIQRLYVESTDFSAKLKGSFLFDKLEVAYPDILPLSRETELN